MKLIFKISYCGLCETYHNRICNINEIGYGQFFSLGMFIHNVVVRKKFGKVV
jgi:hypothetical protein